MTDFIRCLNIEHRSEFRYTEPAHGSVMLLRLYPREDLGQRMLSFRLEIDPLSVPVIFDDTFGNTCHLFNIHREHRHTTVLSQVSVATAETPSLPAQMSPDAWDSLATLANPADYWEFLAPSHFACFSPLLTAFTEETGIQRGDDPLATLQETASRLHRAFVYTPGSTRVDSPISHILETRQGVCQDYVHVMLAIARGWGIPSRYVSGYLQLAGAVGEQSMANASHAWAEFLLPGIGWLGIDPTNDGLAGGRHVRLAVGRDYADVAPTRGSVFGDGETELDTLVTVVEADQAAPTAAPRREFANVHNIAPTPHAPQQTSEQ